MPIALTTPEAAPNRAFGQLFQTNGILLRKKDHLMKTTLLAVCFLCFLGATTAALGQTAPVLNGQAQPLQMSGHPEHASEHSMGRDTSLFGSSAYSYEKGEVPLWEFGSPIHHTPLGDLARQARKEHAALPKATVVLEK
jgi:hypothetical protein